jgi:thioredoxin 1
MATVELTKDTFTDTVGRRPLAVVDFWAAWCPPCRAFGPIFEAASNRHPDVLFGKVNTEVERELAGSFNIQAIPTLVVVRNGTVIHNQAGGLTAQQLADLIRDVRGTAAERVVDSRPVQPGVVLGGRRSPSVNRAVGPE